MARYRQIRIDWHTHRKTAGLSPLARDLVLQALCDNVAGILERSVRRMVAFAGRGVTPQDVEDALAELVDPTRPHGSIARWWPDLEVLWVIEAADEQAKGAKAWEGVEAIVLAIADPVRRAFVDRYRPRLSDRIVDPYPIEVAEAPLGRSEGPTLPDPAPVLVPDPAPARVRELVAGIPLRVPSATPPRSRNSEIDETDLDDPDVRSSGDVVLPPGAPLTLAWLYEQWGHERGQWSVDERNRVPWFARDAQTAAGFENARADFGDVVVEAVVRWSWAEARAGRLEPRLLACTFRGAGFGARVEQWRKATETERRRARLGLDNATPTPAEEGPPVDFSVFADATERLAARLRGAS